MADERRIVPIWQTPGAAGEVYDQTTAAALAGVTVRVFMKYSRMGLYQPLGDAARRGYYFDLEAVYLVRQAEQMRLQLGVEMRVASLIVKLRQEVETLRQELEFWRR